MLCHASRPKSATLVAPRTTAVAVAAKNARQAAAGDQHHREEKAELGLERQQADEDAGENRTAFEVLEYEDKGSGGEEFDLTGKDGEKGGG